MALESPGSNLYNGLSVMGILLKKGLKKMGSVFTGILKFFPIAVTTGSILLLPADAYAIQLHLTSEGIITHQMGHIFFLISMVALIFTLSGKGLDKQKGWRLIQYSAFFFILWNLDAVLGHFLDNQIHAVAIKNISITTMQMEVYDNSTVLYRIYYALKLDHLLAVPAMLLFYMGLSRLVREQRHNSVKKETL
ncbi:MAG: hypothetical protein WC836_11810 [Desulfobacula sp.]|jgi:hypothetical protein